MKLFDGEITISNYEKLAITTHRLRFSDKRLKYAVLLEEISTLEYRYKTQSIYLYLGIVLAVLSGFAFINGYGPDKAGMVGGFSVIFFIVYIFSKTRVLTVTSRGSSKLDLKVPSKEMAEELINKVEQLKMDRIKAK